MWPQHALRASFVCFRFYFQTGSLFITSQTCCDDDLCPLKQSQRSRIFHLRETLHSVLKQMRLCKRLKKLDLWQDLQNSFNVSGELLHPHLDTSSNITHSFCCNLTTSLRKHQYQQHPPLSQSQHRKKILQIQDEIRELFYDFFFA